MIMKIKLFFLLIFLFSLLFNLFIGWSPMKGEPIMVVGIKRVPSLYLEVDYPENENNNTEIWYYEKGLPIMYYSYRIGSLENDFFVAKLIKFISWVWVFMLVGYLVVIYRKLK